MRKIVLLGIVFTLATAGVAFGKKTNRNTIENTLGEFFRIYLMKPEKRSPQDVVKVTRLKKGGYSAEMSYWRTLKTRDAKDEVCNAYRWLLLGRGVYGKGAMEAFKKYPTLKRIYLKFVDIDYGTKKGKKRAEILPTQKVYSYLRVGVYRSSLMKKNANWKLVKKELDRGRCSKIGKRYLDVRWSNKQYVSNL